MYKRLSTAMTVRRTALLAVVGVLALGGGAYLVIADDSAPPATKAKGPASAVAGATAEGKPKSGGSTPATEPASTPEPADTFVADVEPDSDSDSDDTGSSPDKPKAEKDKPKKDKAEQDKPKDSAAPQGSAPEGSVAAEDKGVPFAIAGSANAFLHPGIWRPIALTISNPNHSAIYVTALRVSAADAPGCAADDNVELAQPDVDATDAKRIEVSAQGSVAVPAAQQAQIRLRNLPTVNQDACRGKTFQLTYTGEAAKK